MKKRDVTLDQIKEYKEDAESKIAKILYELEEKTHSVVDEVHCIRMYDSQPHSEIKDVNIIIQVIL